MMLFNIGNKLQRPKDPNMSQERDSYDPILGMGLRPSILLYGGAWILCEHLDLDFFRIVRKYHWSFSIHAFL